MFSILYYFLQGKARKKKPCTRPIPFNLSQPKSSRMATENQQPLTVSQSRTGSHAVQPDNNICNAHLKTSNINAKPIKHPAKLKSNVDSTKGTRKSNGNSLSSIPYNAMHQSNTTSSAQPALSACLDNMNQLSLKDPTKKLHASQFMTPTAQGHFSKSSIGKLSVLLPSIHLYIHSVDRTNAF